MNVGIVYRSIVQRNHFQKLANMFGAGLPQILLGLPGLSSFHVDSVQSPLSGSNANPGSNVHGAVVSSSSCVSTLSRIPLSQNMILITSVVRGSD